MSSVSGYRGVYAVSWAQVRIADAADLTPEDMAVGITWRWSGALRRLDSDTPALWLDRPRNRAETRSRVQRRAHRMSATAGGEAPAASFTQDPTINDTPPAGRGFVLTDGQRVYPARLVQAMGQWLAVFSPLAPPQDRDLWVCQCDLSGMHAPSASGVICFLPGTLIDTPQGARKVEALRPGDLVQTRDNGAQPLVWSGQTVLRGAELYLHPDLRPIRIAAGALGEGAPQPDLFVSPGHRLLRRAPQALGGEVLIAARDLIDGRAVRRDFSQSTVTYLHLMLESHQILTANGVACESFHPGLAEERVLQWHARSLEKARPGLTRDPWALGDPARRCLSAGEAAIARSALV